MRPSSNRHRTAVIVSAFAALAFAPLAHAQDTTRAGNKLVPDVGEGDTIGELPAELDGLEIVENVGAEMPRNLSFRDDNDQPVVLAKYFGGDLPVLLTFNYSNCPMLCSVQLDTLVRALQEVDGLAVGEQYQIITVSLDPDETPETARQTKERYVALFPEAQRDSVRAGWHFLTADKATVDTLADAAGFRYRYVEKTGEYVHAATLIFLSPWGTLTRYIHGIGYVPEQLKTSIFQAGAGEHGISIGFLLACFRHDPDADSYADAGESVMRIGGVTFVFLLLGGYWLWSRRRLRQGQHAMSWEQARERKQQEGYDA